jgi:hypothetical protein
VRRGEAEPGHVVAALERGVDDPPQIDELVVKLSPVVVGEGIGLWRGPFQPSACGSPTPALSTAGSSG